MKPGEKIFFTLIAITFFIMIGELDGQIEFPQKPDLNVTYISQRPLYPGYWMAYPNDIPTFWVADSLSPESSRKVSKEEYTKIVKHKPAQGDEVTFTAHIRNNGFIPSPETDYKLYLDDKVVDKGKVKGLGVGEEFSIPYKWKYQEGQHTISCEADTENKVDEICEINNRLTDPTWGIGLTIRTFNDANYKGFRNTPNMWGSYSFEDWCQAHIQMWRKAFREAIYPASPEGIVQGIRFDGIFTNQNDPALVELREKDLQDVIKTLGRPEKSFSEGDLGWYKTEGCAWRIDWKLDDIPNYAKKIDMGLIHELCHQCGIIDLYQLGMHMSQNLVTDHKGHFLWVGEGAYNQHNDLMCVAGENPPECLPTKGFFREHTAAAFNSEIGKPRGGFGLYLFDLPKHNILRIVDNRGNPIKGAKIKLYQQEIDTKTVGKIPPKNGVTDENGEWDMGERPVDKIHVVGTNVIMLIEINAYEQWEYHCFLLTEMNIAFWRGNHDRAVYTMETGIAPLESCPSPSNVVMKPISLEKGVVTWTYPDNTRNVQKFIVMKRTENLSTVYTPTFQEIIGTVWANERSCKIPIKANPREFYTVVAIDEMGNRSGYSEIAIYPNDEVLPRIDRAWGAVQTPDGAIYTVNSDVATIFGIDPKGGRLSFTDKIRMETYENVACIASDDKGILYVPNPKSGYIYRIDPKKVELLKELKCDAFAAPRGISVDSKGNFFISDVGNKKIHIITKEGKLLGSFGGPDVFNYPRNVYVDKNYRVYVSDCLTKNKEFGRSPAKIHVFERTSPDAWEFKNILTIDNLKWIECAISDSEGRIYAGGPDGIEVFDAKGTPITKWGSKPYGCPMGAYGVYGLSWDNKGDLLVTQGFTLRWLIRVKLTEIFTENN
jgi:hypothetical protein